MTSRVAYDQVAPDYDRRFRLGGLPGVERALASAARATDGRRVLEVGCGTGHWLPAFRATRALGVDRSLGMLARAAAKAGPGAAGTLLAAAEAHSLPFSAANFDVVACVNALHHFGQTRDFLASAVRLLRPGGALVVIGMDPGAGRDRWYLYDYFPESLPPDLERYPPHAAVRRWMRELGLGRVTTRTAHRIQGVFAGAQVFDDPILHRNGTSQLTLLDDAAFARGMARIRDAVAKPGAAPTFVTDLWLPVTRGFVPRSTGSREPGRGGSTTSRAR